MGGGAQQTQNPMASYSPQTTQGSAPNAFEQGAGAMQFGLTPGAVPYTMNQYMNPYQSQVVGDTMGRMRDEMNMGLNDVRGQAAQASAYGGARQGLVEAQLMDRYQRNMGETAGALNQQGFNTSAQLGQNRIAQLMGGGQNLYGMGQSALQQQQMAGMQQQNLMQQILGQGAGQYDQYANYPNTALGTALSAIQGNPMGQTGTQTSGYNPGLFDYLAFGGGLMGGGK